MKDTNSPQEEGGPTSPNTSNPHGIFSPAQRKDGSKKAIGGEIRKPADSLNSQENQESREYFLGRVDSLLQRILSMQSNIRVVASLEELTAIAKDVTDVKNHLGSKGRAINETLKSLLSEKERQVSAIEEEILEAGNNHLIEINDALTAQERAERHANLMKTRIRYTIIKYQLQSDILRIKSSDVTVLPSKKSILSTLTELAWLEDDKKLEELADDENFDIGALGTKIEILYNEISLAIPALNQKENDRAKAETLQRLLKEGGGLSEDFKSYKEKINNLKVLDTSLISEREKLEEEVTKDEKTFLKSPSSETLIAFIKSLNEYPKLLQKMEKKVIATIPPPAFLSRTTPPQESEAKALGYELNNIIRDPLTVPDVILITCDNYRRLFNDPKNTDIDFSQATALNNEILKAINEGDIARADKNARLLGKELDTILLKKQSLQSEPSPASTVDQKAELNVGVSTKDIPEQSKNNQESIRYEGTVRRGSTGLQIKIGGDFKDIPKKISTSLYSYKQAYDDQSNKGEDFSLVIKKKEEILKNVTLGNFEEALKIAQELNNELANMPSGKENTQERFNNPPVGEIISFLTKGRLSDAQIKKREASGRTEEQEVLQDIDTWTNKWLISGALDTFRKNNGNIPITEAQITSTKKLLYAYFEIIKRDTGMNGDILRGANQNIIILVKILTGVHNEAKSDIKHLVESYKESEDAALLQKLLDYTKNKEGGTPDLSTPPLTKSPLRSTVSGSTPSPKQAKIAIDKNFEIQKTALVNAHEILEKILPLLTSEHEKVVFTRLSRELLELQNSITETPTPELLAKFAAKVERFTEELSKKERYVDAVYGKERVSSPLFKQTLRPDTKVMRSKRLRGDKAQEEKLEQWTARQATQSYSRQLEETRQEKAKQELYDKHSEIFKKNPSLYQEIYGEKNNVRDPLTQDISGRVAREVVLDLQKKRHGVMAKIIQLEADKLEGSYTDKYDADLAALNKEVVDIDTETKKYTEINLTKTTTIPQNNSLLRNKQVYSPRKDNTDMSEGLGRNYTLDEHNNPIKIDRAALTQAEIKDIYAQENNPLDDKTSGVRHLKEKVLLSDGLYPNHTEGMVPYLDEHKGISASEAHAQETAQLAEEEEAEEIAPPEKQPQNPESQKERHVAVNKLTDVLFRYLSTRLHPWGWLAAGLSVLAISTATGYALGTTIKNKNEGKTLADVIKNQPSWRTFMSEDIPKWFIENLSAPSDKNFTALIEASAPSFVISEANPSAKEKISGLIVKDVYEFEDSGVGLTRSQQEEASLFIKRLQDILKVTKAPSGILYDKNTLLFGDLTLRGLYQKTGEIIAATDKEEARLRTT